MRTSLSNRGADVVDEVYVPLAASRTDIDSVIARIKQSGPVIVFSTMVGKGAVDFYKAYDKAGFDSTEAPICSVTAGELEMAAIGKDAVEGNIKVAPYFSVIQNAANRRFVSSFRERFGGTVPLCAEREAAHFQVKFFAEAVKQVGTTERRALMHVLPTISFDSPQGMVRIDAATNHTLL